MKTLHDAWANVSKPVIGMLHLPALPGSPLYVGSIAPIREAMLRDAQLLAEGGVHGLMIENFGDVPSFVEAAEKGAVDFLFKPFRIDDMKAAIRKALQGDGGRAHDGSPGPGP